MTQRAFEDTQAMPGERSYRPRDADVIATLGTDTLLRDSINAMLQVRSVFGDEEAFLADVSADVAANLQIIASTWQKYPERVLAGVLANMTPEERAAATQRIRDMLKEIEEHQDSIVDQVPDNPTPVMLTGTRSLSDTSFTVAAMGKVIAQLKDEYGDLIIISGGAEGADQAWAEAAIDTDTPFVLYLPNWAYGLNYGQDETLTDSFISHPLCLGVEYSVERPQTEDWKRLWGKELWWKDNFVRNDKMIAAAQVHVICGPHRPETIFTTPNIKGGTAACVRSMKRLGVEKAVYINSEDTSDIVWVQF